MDPVMGVIFILGIMWAARSGFRLAREARKSSGDAQVSAAEKASWTPLTPDQRAIIRRQHARGWWASEVGHGFPVHRTGLHAGWLAHKTAAVQARHMREEAKTGHQEVAASFGSRLAEHKQRREAIRQEIGAQNPDPAGGKEAVRQAAEAAGVASVTALDSRRPLPAASRPRPGPYGPKSGEADARLLGEQHRDAGVRPFGDLDEGGEAGLMTALGETGPATEENWGRRGGLLDAYTEGLEGRERRASEHLARCSDPFCPACLAQIKANEAPVPAGEWPAGIPRKRKTGNHSTEGAVMTTTTAETTYDETQAKLRTGVAQQENIIAELRLARLADMVDELSTTGLDAGTLGRLADVSDGYRDQIKAAEQTLDNLQAASDGLRRDHGAANEAMQAAPGGGAERGFYQA